MEGGRGPQLLSGFRFLLPLAPAGYRRQGQVLPFKADFPRLGCAQSCLRRSLGHSVLIKMCTHRDVGPLGEEGEPSHLTILLSVSSFTDLHGRGKNRGKGSGFICDVLSLGWAGQTFPGPRGSRFQAEGSGPTDPALSEGAELSNARVELGHPLPCQD